MPKHYTLQALRYSSRGEDWGEGKPVTLEVAVRDYDKIGPYVEVVSGGVTGHESMSLHYMNDWFKPDEKRVWAACLGTLGRWDRLDVPASEMKALAARLVEDGVLREESR